MIFDAKNYGVDTLWSLVRESVKGYRGVGPLLDTVRVGKLAESLAAVNATAELMGRSRVREMQRRALESGGLSKFKDDVPWSTFADSPTGVIDTPQAALDYFTRLVPKLGIDPERFVGEQKRKAFTLAASTNKVLTAKIQDVIRKGLGESKGVADVTAKITEALSLAGVTPRHKQYAEMVYRTNANDSFQTGLYEEGRHEDVREVFPAWRYLIVNDTRTGDDHRPKGNRYYPSEATFSDVRGKRPYNCRCSMQWIDFMDWEELVTRGVKMERSW